MSDIRAVPGSPPPVVTANPINKTQSPAAAVAAAPVAAVEAPAASGGAVLSISPQGQQQFEQMSASGVAGPGAGVTAAPATPPAPADTADSAAVKRYEDVAKMGESGWTSLKSAVRDAAAQVGLAEPAPATAAAAATAAAPVAV
nr:hypothetical protein [uncultured Rhodoferax sp.]